MLDIVFFSVLLHVSGINTIPPKKGNWSHFNCSSFHESITNC